MFPRYANLKLAWTRIEGMTSSCSTTLSLTLTLTLSLTLSL
jgi:hypothetical protein